MATCNDCLRNTTNCSCTPRYHEGAPRPEPPRKPYSRPGFDGRERIPQHKSGDPHCMCGYCRGA